MRRAAEAIKDLGVPAVLVKGGHRSELLTEAVDILIDDVGTISEFREEYIEVGEIDGSDWHLSATIAAYLEKEMILRDAVGAAKKYLTDQIRRLTRSSPSPF